MPRVTLDLPEQVVYALQSRSRAAGEAVSDTAARVLEHALLPPVRTLFQVSTSRALVQGIYCEALSIAQLLEHGDFGLGTFDFLDGEMVVLEGKVYQVSSDGTVKAVGSDVGTPYATVLPFQADTDVAISPVESYVQLCAACEGYRSSHNDFYALRVDGVFSRVQTRAMRLTEEGVPLKQAAATQPEFHFSNVAGTMVGFWSPPFAEAIGIPGYHLHFLSEDRTQGGHVMDCAGDALRLRVQVIHDLHLTMPQTQEFLRADLTASVTQDLDAAEGQHTKDPS